MFPSPLHVGLNTSAETREKLVSGKSLVFCLHLFLFVFLRQRKQGKNVIPERNLVFRERLGLITSTEI